MYELEVTTVERVETVPAAGAVTGLTLGVTNNLDTRTSAIVLASYLRVDHDGGVPMAAAKLSAGGMYPRARSSHRSAELQASISPIPTTAGAALAEAAASADPSGRPAHPKTNSVESVNSKPVSIVDEMAIGVDRRGDGLVAQTGRYHVNGHIAGQ